MEGNTTTFDFSIALELLKQGKKVARQGWNGQGMFAVLSPGNNNFPVDKLFSESLKNYFNLQEDVKIRPSLLLKTAQEDIAYWVPSCSDILSTDWYKVSDTETVHGTDAS